MFHLRNNNNNNEFDFENRPNDLFGFCLILFYNFGISSFKKFILILYVLKVVRNGQYVNAKLTLLII